MVTLCPSLCSCSRSVGLRWCTYGDAVYPSVCSCSRSVHHRSVYTSCTAARRHRPAPAARCCATSPPTSRTRASRRRAARRRWSGPAPAHSGETGCLSVVSVTTSGSAPGAGPASPLALPLALAVILSQRNRAMILILSPFPPLSPSLLLRLRAPSSPSLSISNLHQYPTHSARLCSRGGCYDRGTGSRYSSPPGSILTRQLGTLDHGPTRDPSRSDLCVPPRRPPGVVGLE